MQLHAVRDWVDVYHLQRRTFDFAASIGFGRRECGELAIVASELTSNILKYGVSGAIELAELKSERGEGLLIVASDKGPPFKNLALAMQDGYDDDGPIDPGRILTRKGMGGGLGAIVRLSHEFAVEDEPGGKRIRVVRYRG